MRAAPHLVAALLLAGCFGATDAPAQTAAAPEVDVDASRPEPVFTDIPSASLGRLAAPDANATLEAPPRLAAGEWWRIRFTSALTDETVEFVRVVAKVNDDGSYVLGMPHEGWYKEAVIYHVPFFGDVHADLSGHAHDIPFIPLKFPLTEGATWETYFESENQPLTATVTVESPTVARVAFTGPKCGAVSLAMPCPEGSDVGPVSELVYDATIHEIREWSHVVGHHYEVVEHGTGFEGWVTVPRGEDLVFLHGRIGTPFVDMTLQPALPLDTVTVEGGFNRVSFILGAGTLAGQGGAFQLRATAPDGAEYVAESIPGAPIVWQFLEHANPDGEWKLDYLAAGPGYVFIEGIAYHQYDIRLPDGATRSDHAHEVIR